MKKIVFLLCLMLFSGFSYAQSWNIEDGIKFFKQKKYGSAKTFFEDFIKTNPNNAEAYYYLGLIYREENDLKKSRYYFKQSFALTNSEYEVKVAPRIENIPYEDYLDIAQMFFEANDFENALNHIKILEEIDPDNTKVHLLKTKIYLELGKKDYAYGSFLRVLENDKNYLNSSLADIFGIEKMPELDDEFYNSKAMQYFFAGDIEKPRSWLPV